MSKEDKNLAHSIGLVQVNTEDAIDEAAYDILYSMYRVDPRPHKEEMEDLAANAPMNMSEAAKKAYLKSVEDFTEEKVNEKIRALFEKWTGGAKWMDNPDKVKSMLLLGPPGQGKTTTFKAAAEKVAKGLGMDFKLNPTDEVPITKKDFMFVSMEFSGENQVTVIGGIPAKVKDDITGIEYMTKLVNRRLAMARRAGGALVLLDDFPNATPSVQNVGLSLTDEKRFQGLNLENVYIGLTGNLGSLDGTHTAPLSTALRGRCKIYYTEDELPNWVNRVQQKYRDDIGDVGVSGFLLCQQRAQKSSANNYGYFAEMPNTREKGGFASPRTWEHFLQEAYNAIAQKGGAGHEASALGQIQRHANAMLGLETGEVTGKYFASYAKTALPLATRAILRGDFDEKGLKDMLRDDAPDEKSGKVFYLGDQIAVALGDQTVNALMSAGLSSDMKPTGKGKDAIENFAKAVSALDDGCLRFATDYLKSKLANNIRGAVAEQESGWESAPQNLEKAVKEMLEKGISQSKDFSAEKAQRVIDSFAGGEVGGYRKRR